MAVEDVERALGTEVDRQQLAAAPQDAAQDRLAGGGIGGVDLVQPLLGRGVDAMEAIVAADREQFELAARADATIIAHLRLGCAGVVPFGREDERRSRISYIVAHEIGRGACRERGWQY